MGEFKFGYRSIKTVLAVSLTLLISWFLGRGTGFYGANAAVVCMQPTQKESIGSGFIRILGTLIGAFFGYFLLTTAKSYPAYFETAYLYMIPLYLVLVIGFCALIRKYEAISLSAIIFLSIATDFAFDIPNIANYVLWRIADTSVGIVVAMLINRFVFPVKSNKENDKRNKMKLNVEPVSLSDDDKS